MVKYIPCITHTLLNARRILMSSCPGESSLYDTHCQYCYHWMENQGDHDDPEEDDDEDFSRENLSEQSDNGYILEDKDDEEATQ